MHSHTQLSVLIVSDEPGATRILLAIFRAIEITKITVIGGADILEYDHFDMAVICDSGNFPALLDTADRVRQTRSGKGAYIVVVSLFDTDELKRCIEWGRIDAVMLKPITIFGLTSQIECAIERAMRA